MVQMMSVEAEAGVAFYPARLPDGRQKSHRRVFFRASKLLYLHVAFVVWALEAAHLR